MASETPSYFMESREPVYKTSRLEEESGQAITQRVKDTSDKINGISPIHKIFKETEDGKEQIGSDVNDFMLASQILVLLEKDKIPEKIAERYLDGPEQLSHPDRKMIRDKVDQVQEA